MLEVVLIVTLVMIIAVLAVASLDQLKKWGIGLANDLIDLQEKMQLSKIKVEGKRLELERREESL